MLACDLAKDLNGKEPTFPTRGLHVDRPYLDSKVIGNIWGGQKLHIGIVSANGATYLLSTDGIIAPEVAAVLNTKGPMRTGDGAVVGGIINLPVAEEDGTGGGGFICL